MMNYRARQKSSEFFKSAICNPQSAILAVFAAMLAVSWRRWTSPIADSGREMDLPLRLMEGEWLYRDVHYIYPPLAPYLNSLLYRLFGAHLDILHAAGIACSILIAALCYRIARRLLDPFESAIATIAVVIFCIFKPAGNMIQPYAFAALYACLFALGVLLLTLRYAESLRKVELIFAGLLIGLAAITKQEFAIAAAATVTAAQIYIHRTDFKSLISNLAIAALPAALITFPVYAWLISNLGWQTIIEDCHLFYTHLPASLVYYNSQRTGLDRPLLSLVQMLGGAVVATAALSFVVMLSDRTHKLMKMSVSVFVGSFAVIAITKLAAGKQWDGSPLRALPFMLAGLLFVCLRNTQKNEMADGSKKRNPQSAIRNRALVIIAVYSLAILARVALRVPSGGAFGGFFLPTSLILFCYVFWQMLPAAVGSWTADEASVRRARLIARAMLLVTILAAAVTFGIRYRKNFDYEISVERGHLFAPKVTGNEISKALQFIRQSTHPGEAIAVLPEGSDLAFLIDRRMPLRHQILIPGLMSERDEQTAIKRLQSDAVRYVLIVNRPMREFGLEAFGRDFYRQLWSFIETNYQLVKVCGQSLGANPEIGDSSFFIKIYERKEE